jgi:3-deoxy-D-manno-octulosonic acid kinase
MGWIESFGTEPGYVVVPHPTLRILVRRGYEEALSGAWSAGGTLLVLDRVGGGRAAHPLVELTGGERVMLRRYLRGGAIRHVIHDRYLLGHRAFHELRATARAARGGAPVPEILGAWEEPRAIGYTASIAVRWIEGAHDLDARLRQVERQEGLDSLRAAGAAIERLHAAGIGHPDLNLRNLLVRQRPDGGGETVHLVDLDRARIFTGPAPSPRRARDLLRLARSARKLGTPVPAGGWAAFREGYGSTWPLRTELG